MVVQTAFLLALTRLKGLVGFVNGFRGPRLENGFFLGEANCTNRFFAPHPNGRRRFERFGSAAPILGVHPTAAAQAEDIHTLLTTKHTK